MKSILAQLLFRSSSSRRSRSSNASETRARAIAEAAKRKVEWQYANLEMQKKVELKMKECEMEELRERKIMKELRLKQPPWLRLKKKRRKIRNPCLIAWMISLAKLIRKIVCVNIWQRFLLPLLTPVLLQLILWITSRTPQVLL